ncbi:LLM class flavin-dependent oxidoreductase [Halorarius halobius]|uniref:LLM class flavin-dependent oxidoreductase n=1 Tax=Halorarius halobius TaxID=2962671 RepID=UPI0020CEA58D|nr:LLM class flavin-dependent oxidoreductase [Halorarius halobius]
MEFGLGLLTAQRADATKKTHEQVFRETVDIAQVAEDSGFDAVWTSEHHFFDDGYLPSVFPLCGALATATETIDIGTAVALGPLYDPIRFAEDAATVDLLSGGRLRVGIANGYVREEFEVFDVPLSERAPRVEELLEICRGAWTPGAFSHEGELFQYDDVDVEPKPAQDGGPPVLLGGMSKPAVRRAARMADGHIGFVYYPDDWAERLTYEHFERNVSLAEATRNDDDPFSVVLMQFAHVAETDEQAWNELAPRLVAARRAYARQTESGDVSDWDIDTMSDDRLDALREGALVGSPETVIERLRELDRMVPGELHVIPRMVFPELSADRLTENVQRFGDSVVAELS